MNISLNERKKMRNFLIVKMFLFCIFIIVPLSVLQELFVFTYIVPSLDLPIVPLLVSYFKNHHMATSYAIFIMCMLVGLGFFLSQYIRYIMTGENQDSIKNKFENPLMMLTYFMIVANIGNIVNLALDFNYIISLPKLTLVHFFTFKFVWQILLSMLIVYYFFYVSTDIRKTLGLHSFPVDKLSIYSRLKTTIIIVLQFIFFSINITEVLYLISVDVSRIDYIILWGCLTTVGVIIMVNTLFFIQNSIDSQIKTQMFKDIQELASNGNLTKQHTFYEKNVLGSFVSEFNVLIADIRQGIQQIDESTKLLNSESSQLKDNTKNLIDTISEQEVNVSQMNMTTNATSTTVQYLLSEVESQSNALTQEQQKIDSLISGTQDIMETFQNITQEHKLSQEANQKAIDAVEKSLVKTELMNTQIDSIHQNIHTAGLETSAIDEALGIIKNISEQTNLLSMSAAIEAAHGDTSRKGFTLVAEEIRKLALMSQESAGKAEVRLSTIKDHITEAYNISKESIDLSRSSLRVGEHLKNSLKQIHSTSIELQNITQQAEPITHEQNEMILKFQDIISNMKEFLYELITELKKDNTSAVMMSLKFRTMIQNFKKSRSSLYYMETSLEHLNIIENHLKSIVQEFKFSETSDKE